MIFRTFFLLVIGFLVLAPSVPAAPLAANLPLDSWVYPALDKFAGLGLVDSSLAGTRPYTRREAARLVRMARRRADRVAAPGAVYELLARLEREFKNQLADISGGVSSSYLQPLRNVELAYLSLHGQPSIFPGTNARQFDLNYNNFGLDYADGQNAQLSFESEARLAGLLLVHVRPVFAVQNPDRQAADTAFGLLEGKLALNLGQIELSLGRQALWWGPGRHGSLLLSNNAKPLDMLRLTNPEPVLLPWLFSALGPFRFDLFWSRLDSERTVPNPYLAGLRLDFKPFPWLELGASRTALFGGKGRPGVGFADFLTILGGKNLSGAADTSDQLAALDASLRLPFWGAEVYGEWGGEDEAGRFIANDAYLAGLYLAKPEPSGRLSLRCEYADLSRLDANSPPWYHHGIYRSGYTYQQKILGHHVGGAATDTLVEMRLLLPGDVSLALSGDLERRGYDQPLREEHRQSALEVNWQAQELVSLRLRYALSRVKNFAYRAGDDRTLHLAEVSGLIVW